MTWRWPSRCCGCDRSSSELFRSLCASPWGRHLADKRIASEHELAGVHRGLFEITRVRGKHLPARHLRAEDLNRSHVRKLATQAVVVLRRRREPDAVVGSFVARVAQDDYTKALLSAVPIPDPRAMKERKAARRKLRHALAEGV